MTDRPCQEIPAGRLDPLLNLLLLALRAVLRQSCAPRSQNACNETPLKECERLDVENIPKSAHGNVSEPNDFKLTARLAIIWLGRGIPVPSVIDNRNDSAHEIRTVEFLAHGLRHWREQHVLQRILLEPLHIPEALRILFAPVARAIRPRVLAAQPELEASLFVIIGPERGVLVHEGRAEHAPHHPSPVFEPLPGKPLLALFRQRELVQMRVLPAKGAPLTTAKPHSEMPSGGRFSTRIAGIRAQIQPCRNSSSGLGRSTSGSNLGKP